MKPKSNPFLCHSLAFTAMLGLGASFAAADIVSPSVDLRVLSTNAESNDPNTLSLYNDGGNTQRTFLQFDLGSYSGKSITTDATLTLVAGIFGNFLTGVSLGTANSAWTQGGDTPITWNNQPGINPIAGATNPSGTFGSGPVTWTIPWYMLEKLATTGSGYNNGLGITSGVGSTQHFQSTGSGGPAPTLTFSAATGASSTWTGGNGNWTDTANWAASTVAEGIGQAATINGGTAVDIAMDANRSVGSISFSGADHTISSGAGKLALNVVSGSPTISVETTRIATISAALVGLDGLAKTDTGKLVLTGTNSYTGTTTVNAGTLSLAAAGALTSGGGVTIGAGGKLSNDAPAGNSFALTGLTMTGGELAATNAPDTSLGNFFLNGNVTVGGSALSTISADLRVISNQTRDFNVSSTGDPSGVDLLISGKIGHQNNVAWGYATKSGAGTMKLSGITELGGMTVNAGRLILEDTAIGWTFPVQGLTNNAQLEFSVTSGSRSYTAGIAGSGALFKTGSGTMTLSGSNTYSGGTTINDGTMIASGLGSGAVTIASGATLSTTSASSTGLAALYYNNSIDQGNIATLAALLTHLGGNSPAPSLVNTATSMNFAGNGSGFPAPYNSGGANFEAFYSGKLNITTPGTYTFNTSSDDGSMLFIDGQAVVTNNFFQGLATRTGSIALTAGMHDIVIAYNQGGGGYGMNAQISGADDTNMVDINTSNASITPDLVVGSLAGAGNVVLSTGNLITGIDNSSTSFTGVISGIGSVTKFGPGVQTLGGANTYSGVTTLQSGVLNVATFSDYGVDGGLGNRASDGSEVGILFRGGTLQYTGATAQTTNRAIRISTLGGATIDASGSSPSATLSFTASTSTNFFEYPGNRSLTLTGSNTGDNAFAMAIGEVGGATAVVKSGAGKWVLSGNNTYTGSTSINNGTLLATRNTLGTGAVVINNGGTLYANDQWVLCGINDHGVAERNIGTLTINAGGTLQLDAVQGFANGATNLYLNGGLVTGGPNNHRGDLFLYNGNEQITAGGATTSTIASVIGLTGNNNTITVDGGSTLNISGLVKNSDWIGNGGGSGGIIKAGSGTLTLTAANSYTGSTTVDAGTFAIQNSYNSSGFTISTNAVLELNVASGLRDYAGTTFSGTGILRKTGDGGAIWGGSTANFSLGSASLIDVQAGSLTGGSHANENWSSNLASLNVADGALFHGVEANVRVDALTGSGTITSGYSGAGYQNFTFGVNNGSGTFSGVLADSDTAAGNFVKAGTGTQALTGANTYSGSTTINGGTLAISSAYLNDSSTVSIASGAVLLLTHALTDTVNELWVGGVQKSPGIYNASNSSGFITGTGSLNVTSGPAVPDFDTWGAPYGLASGSEGGDLDNDGVTNFGEYAFGLTPNSGASVNPITVPLDKSTGTFSYTRRKTSLGTGLTYSVWFSENLDGWTQDTPDAIDVTPIPSSDNETVEVTLSTFPGDPLPDKLFIQVRAN